MEIIFILLICTRSVSYTHLDVYKRQRDGDLYNYIKYGVNTTSDDGAEKDMDASKAVDGNTGTRWSNSNHIKGHWIQIDLKQSYSVSKIGISWEVASSIDYKIEISNDGRSYKEVSRVKISDYTDPKNRVDTVALSNEMCIRDRCMKIDIHVF